MKEYYNHPTQVIFIEEDDLIKAGPDNVTYCEGIAIANFVICKCCGEVIYLDEIAYIYEFDTWYDYGCENFYQLSIDNEKMSKVQSDIKDIYEWLIDEI